MEQADAFGRAERESGCSTYITIYCVFFSFDAGRTGDFACSLGCLRCFEHSSRLYCACLSLALVLSTFVGIRSDRFGFALFRVCCCLFSFSRLYFDGAKRDANA